MTAKQEQIKSSCFLYCMEKVKWQTMCLHGTAASRFRMNCIHKLFCALAVAWLEKGTLQNAYHQINDVHPMGYLLVNCTLQQFDEFIDFYGIKKGDGMYLAPEDRVAIW